MKKVWLVLVLASCGAGSPAQRVRNAAGLLPSCFGGTEVGSVNVGYSCDSILCDAPCCNSCRLSSVELMTTNGASTVSLNRARDVLDLADSVTSCEATEVRRVSDGLRMRFDPDACVVR